MSTIRYVWQHRSWKLTKVLYRTYVWRTASTIILLLLLLLFVAEDTYILWVPSRGGR